MFKKNKNGEETVKVKTKLFKGKHKKEKKSNKDESEFFIFSEFCTFKDFRTYCSDLTADGDWIINLGNSDGIMSTYDPETASDDQEYDENLLQVYRRQDDSLVTKNTKMLGEEEGGLRRAASIFCYFMERKLHKHRKEIEVISRHLCEFFDRRTEGHIHIWVPVEKTTSKDCLLVKLLDGRINIIVT